MGTRPDSKELLPGGKKFGERCEHGSLRRKCEICQRDMEIADLKQTLAEETRYKEDYKGRYYTWLEAFGEKDKQFTAALKERDVAQEAAAQNFEALRLTRRDLAKLRRDLDLIADEFGEWGDDHLTAGTRQAKRAGSFYKRLKALASAEKAVGGLHLHPSDDKPADAAVKLDKDECGCPRTFKQLRDSENDHLPCCQLYWCPFPGHLPLPKAKCTSDHK